MLRTVFLIALAAFASAQYKNDPRNAAILSEARYLQGDGKFGAAYTQEDGVEFKEESDADGTRRGTYSWVDPTGERRTVSYVAGKNGFQASGAHLPVGPAQEPPVALQPQYTPLPQYNSPPEPEYTAPQQQYRPQPQYNPAPQPQYNPQPRPQYNPPPPQPQYNPPPQQPQYNPPPPQPQYRPQPQYNPPPQEPQYSPPQYRAPSYTTTPPPHRFFPPGKLSLNRSPDGYSYTFNKA